MESWSNEVMDSTSLASKIKIQNPKSADSQLSALSALHSPWNLYFRVTMPDAIQFGLVDTINRARGTSISPGQFLADCRSAPATKRSSSRPTCATPSAPPPTTSSNGPPSNAAGHDYQIDRVHLESGGIVRQLRRVQS